MSMDILNECICRHCGDEINWQDYTATEEEFYLYKDHDVCQNCDRDHEKWLLAQEEEKAVKF